MISTMPDVATHPVRSADTRPHQRLLWATLLVGVTALVGACASPTPPLERLKTQLADGPDYSIILDDMREEGTFFQSYYHKYQVVQDDNSWTTDWQRVSEEDYHANANFLGMTLASNTGGEENTAPHPPGYQYVGNPRYGEWRTHGSGTSFWAFYGQYALMRDLFGLGRGPIYRSDYDAYQRSRAQRRPYYGPTGGEYGTRGTLTQQRRPSFFQRRRAREVASRQRFQQKFNSRFGRSSSPLRSRGFGFGK